MTQDDQFTQFRNALYRTLPWMADAIMDLIDALASNQGCQSVVALSESPEFRREHGSVFRAIAALRPKGGVRKEDLQAWEQRLRRPIAPLLDRPREGDPWVLSVDGTPMARCHAPTLSDRSYVHQAQAVPGQRPVTIGHEYSLAMLLPARERAEPIWALPLAAARVSTSTSAVAVASEQIEALVTDPRLPMAKELTVAVADSHYSQAGFVRSLASQPNLVTLTRLHRSRVLFRAPEAKEPGAPGRPLRYGAKLRPGTTESLSLATEVLETTASIGKEEQTAKIYRWNDLILKGEQDRRTVSQPCDVVLVTVYGQDGRPCYSQDLALVLVGDRRREIASEAAFRYYRRRFDQEHAHRFLRRNLLLDRFQTPETRSEEAWVDLVILAYQTLYAARHLVSSVRRPWEPKVKPATDLSPKSAPSLSPSQVQRGIARVFAEFGTPARPPRPRGKPPGWSLGAPRRRRRILPLVKRGPPDRRKQDKAA